MVWYGILEWVVDQDCESEIEVKNMRQKPQSEGPGKTSMREGTVELETQGGWKGIQMGRSSNGGSRRMSVMGTRFA